MIVFSESSRRTRKNLSFPLRETIVAAILVLLQPSRRRPRHASSSSCRSSSIFPDRPCTPPRQFSIEDSLCAKEIVDQDGKSSLLSPVKAFDSVVLAIYEGFCNLKQVFR
ncbi:hypothetical protein L3X38_000682 [Prunus dulcis]|uniref:Uncharacterized protein n=1 Tax=Prunus dulcis TaxID=3755 RepID=A0AAD4WQK9_PRUDU|nr:hypothetical protein L3X38_000682 [Prunus dulcis]